MAILVRIKLPNKTEIKKIIRTKKDYFVLMGDNYHIVFGKAYFVKIYAGLIKIACLDYEKGKEEPIDYFNKELKTSTELRPHHVAEVIRRLIEEVPHFQWIMIIFLIILIIITGINIYIGYSNGQNIDKIIKTIEMNI